MLNLWYIVTTVRFEEDWEAEPGLYTSMKCHIVNIGQVQHLPAHNLLPSLTPLLPSFLPQLFSALSNRCPAIPKPKACASSDIWHQHKIQDTLLGDDAETYPLACAGGRREGQGGYKDVGYLNMLLCSSGNKQTHGYIIFDLFSWHLCPE